MTIVCDQDIPFLVEAVRTAWPEVLIFPMKPDEIDATAVQDADVLVVRTRTRVDENLLRNSRVRLVCTATIGFDHIDTRWCDEHGVRWMACPGCNAQAVCDYIEEVLTEFLPSAPSGRTIGIVGVGHVGSLVVRMAKRLGWNVLLNDPPEQIGVSLDEIAKKCDVVTFHTPLTKEGDYPTFHLCDDVFLSLTKPQALIINAARGGVVDEQALLRSGRPFVLDTWENEPYINTEAVIAARCASMHIAGYSLDGKRNATQMCLDAISDEMELPVVSLKKQAFSALLGDSSPGWLERVSRQLKNGPQRFEELRKQYVLR